MSVDQTRDHLFARSRLTGKKNRRTNSGDSLCGRHRTAHRLAVGDDKIVSHPRHLAAQFGDFLQQPSVFDSPPHTQFEFFEIKGLLNEVEGTPLDRRDRVVHGRECGHQHKSGTGVALLCCALDLRSIRPGQSQIAENDVKGLAVRDHLDCGLPIRHFDHTGPLFSEGHHDGLTQRLVVLDHENTSGLRTRVVRVGARVGAHERESRASSVSDHEKHAPRRGHGQLTLWITIW